MTPEIVIATVAKQEGLTVRELLGRCRKRELADARCMAFGILYKQGMPLVKIGRIFNRHHSTVIAALYTLEDLLETDRMFKNKYEQLKEHLHEKAKKQAG